MALLQSKTKRVNSFAIFIATIAPIILCNSCASFSQAESQSTEIADLPVTPITNVVAFGRLLPKGEVISLSVANAEDSRVNKILVKEGDWVEEGQIVAVLQGIERKQGDLAEAKQNVVLQTAKLKKIKSGDAKESEIAAQQAVIDGLQAQLQYETKAKEAAFNSVRAELEQTKLSFERKDSLQRQGAISQEESDQAREKFKVATAILNQRKAELNNTIGTLEKQIIQEKKNLAKLKEVRPVDIEIAEAELAMAQVAVRQRQADLEDTQVRVPVAGRILRINTRVGERVDTEEGIIELGQTKEMYALAEIYETEITKINLGQKATIESEYGGFEGTITGEVTHIGLQVGNKTLAGNSADPNNDENARVVEVKIRINDDDSQKVANLTNMQVQVAIDTEEQSATYSLPELENSHHDLSTTNKIKDRSNLNHIGFLSLGLGIFGLVNFAHASRVKSRQSSLQHSTSNNLPGARPTLYLPPTANLTVTKLATLEQLKNQLYNKTREKQIAIATAEVELRQTKIEYLAATSSLEEEISDLDKLEILQQKLFLVQNTLIQQKSKLDREISNLRQQITQAENNFES